MKKIIYIIILSNLMLTGACVKLDTAPQDFVAPEYYFNTEADLQLALTGVYKVLGERVLYSGADGSLTTVFNTSDEMFHRSSAITYQPAVYNYGPADAQPNNIWQISFRGIERANVLLANIDKPEMDEGRRNIIKGEAKFLRAYFNFIAVQNFGDIPLRKSSISSLKDVFNARTPAKEVYEFIYDEMVQAEALVPDITTYNHAGRITKSAVWGILARVSLYMAGKPINLTSKYNDAITWSNKLINYSYHSLNPDYTQVFKNLIQDKYDTKESIWEVEYFTSGSTEIYTNRGQLGTIMGIQNTVAAYGVATPQYQVQKALFDKYEATDLRRDWAISPYSYVSNQAPNKSNFTAAQIYNRFIGKYRREFEVLVDKSAQNGTNFPLLRLADVLLMAAEAENEVNGPNSKAINYVNLVRRRAYGLNGSTAPTTVADVPTANQASQTAFRKFIQDERARELCFEGWRTLDLKRWGILISTMKELALNIEATAPAAFKFAARAGQNIEEKHNLLPIPESELSVNQNIKQNPGW